VVPFPTGKLYVLPEPKLGGNVHLTGPLINEVAEPPEMALLAVLVTESKFVGVVTRIPEVNVSVPATEAAAFKVTVLLGEVPVLAMVRLLNVAEFPPMV
jgi:hypothetical protein